MKYTLGLFAFWASCSFLWFCLVCPWFFGGVGNSFVIDFRLYWLQDQRKEPATMAEAKNLCALIPLDLHRQICETRELSGLVNTSE